MRKHPLHGQDLRMKKPNKSPEPTAVGASSSAVAVHVASRRWLGLHRWADMQALRLSKIPVGWLLLGTSALVAAAVWADAHTPGKNGLDTLPLAWLFIEVLAPLVSVGCLILLCCRRG